jgi:flagellar protein FlaG
MKVGDVLQDLEAKVQRAGADQRDAPTHDARQSVAAKHEAAPPPAPDKIESVTRQIDSFLRSRNHQLQFRVDQGSGRLVVTVTDGETGEIIRQVPGEDALKMAQHIEDMTGLLDETA